MRVDASATQSPPPSTHSHAHVPKKHARTGPLCVPELPGQSAQSSTQARTACARTACASTPVPRKAPHPAHIATRMCPKNTHKSTCAGSGPMRTALCCFHRAHRNYARQFHGSGHTRPLASAKNIQETNTRLHIQARQIGAGAVAARAHRRCLCAYRRQSNVGEARQCSVYVNMTVCNKWVAFSIFCGNNILKTGLWV